MSIKKPGINSYCIRSLAIYHPISPGLEALLSKNCLEIKLRKDEYLFKRGDLCSNFYFIVKGMLAGSNVLNEESFITFFSFPGEFLTSISGMYGTQPSNESVVALEDAVLIAIPARDILSWYDFFPETNIIARKILEECLKKTHLRGNLGRLKKAIDKYSYFQKELRGKSFDLPAEFIASFLGIKPQTFLKIKERYQDINQNALHQQIESIEYHIHTKQMFRERNLTVTKLAQHLNIKPHRLSFLLNHHYKLNFNEFIKQHRIAYVKNKFIHYQDWHHLSVDGVGFDAGFSSRSSFFSAFKKNTGMTPAEFASMMKSISGD